MPDPVVVARAIARNMRRLRTGKGFTLDELAGRARVSRGMLIQIEQERTNPSVTTLVRIADALGVSIAQLVEVSDAPAVRVVHAADAVPLWRGDGGSVGTLLLGTDPPQAMEMWDWRIEPGDAYDGEAHLPGTRELLHVLAGRLTLTVEDETRAVEAGDTVLFSADREHRYSNAATEPARFVMVVSMPTLGS
jgi:quercetin dioxygenase-like cupin family protein/DNA-binding XRE family transcriptional regulator